jgi:hypothetical protein
MKTRSNGLTKRRMKRPTKRLTKRLTNRRTKRHLPLRRDRFLSAPTAAGPANPNRPTSRTASGTQ